MAYEFFKVYFTTLALIVLAILVILITAYIFLYAHTNCEEKINFIMLRLAVKKQLKPHIAIVVLYAVESLSKSLLFYRMAKCLYPSYCWQNNWLKKLEGLLVLFKMVAPITDKVFWDLQNTSYKNLTLLVLNK